MENSRGVVRCGGTVQENHSEVDGQWYEKTTAGWVGDGARTPRLGGWTIVRENHVGGSTTRRRLRLGGQLTVTTMWVADGARTS